MELLGQSLRSFCKKLSFTRIRDNTLSLLGILGKSYCQTLLILQARYKEIALHLYLQMQWYLQQQF